MTFCSMDTTKTVLPFIDEGVRVSPAQPSANEGPFLFVNETTLSTAFKHGGRQEIRSHVRRNVARRFRREHKGDKAADKAQIKVIRYACLVPHGVSDAEYSTHNCNHNKQSFSRNSRVEPKECRRIQVADTLEKRTGSSTPASATEPSPEVKQNVNDHMLSVLEPGRVLFSSTVPADPTLRDDSQMFCPTCGSKLYGKIRDGGEMKMTEVVMSRLSRGGPFRHSLIDILGSGRVDPFMSYPVNKLTPKLHELMDHTITYLVPGLVPDGYNRAVSPVSKAWFSNGLESPILFHALVFAGSIHLDFLRTSNIYPNSPQALSHKVVVIQKLREIMSNPEQARRDEVILAILVLSSHESMDSSQVGRNPFNSPLKKVQWLNVYGNITYVPEHMKAVMELLSIRGGIEKLELHGLAECIVAGDLISATRSLSKPNLPPFRMSETWMATVLHWATSSPRLPVPKLGRRFRALQDYGVTEDAIFVFDAMVAQTIAVNHYLDGEPASLSVGALSYARTAIQHRLLSLPTAEEINLSFRTKSIRLNIYEACRLTALIYGVAIIFPIPNSYKVLQNLVRSLKASIEVCGMNQLAITLPDFLLWILVLGGIAAFEKPERNWFASHVARLVKERKIDNLERIEEELTSFLWLDSACGPGGRQLWSDMMERLNTLDSHEYENHK